MGESQGFRSPRSQTISEVCIHLVYSTTGTSVRLVFCCFSQILSVGRGMGESQGFWSPRSQTISEVCTHLVYSTTSTSVRLLARVPTSQSGTSFYKVWACLASIIVALSHLSYYLNLAFPSSS